MPVQDTSLIALENLSASGQTGPNQDAILTIIDECGPISDKDILLKLNLKEKNKSIYQRRIPGWAINMVTGRRCELKDKGLIVSCGKFTSSWQRLPVHLWRSLAFAGQSQIPAGWKPYSEDAKRKEERLERNATERRAHLDQIKRTVEQPIVQAMNASQAGRVLREYKKTGRRQTTEPSEQLALFV